MPIDISKVTIKANLKTGKEKKDAQIPAGKMVAEAQVKTEKKVSEMVTHLIPVLRNDLFDRLNR